MGGRINTIMQTCFFAISGVLPRERGDRADQGSIKKTYGKRGETVVAQELRSGRRRRWLTCTRCAVPATDEAHASRRAAGARQFPSRRQPSCATCSAR